MLCCAGLFGGFIIGFLLGGPLIFIAPIIGFIFGLFADIKFMHGRRGCH
jgi:hypothetical protein